MTNQKTKMKFGIRSKILVIFSTFSLVSLVIISSIIGGFLNVIDNTVTDESESALIGQIQTNLMKSATENAFTIGEKIDNAIANVEFLAFFAENLFENPELYGSYPSYHDLNISQPGLNADFYTDQGYGSQYISFDYSMYHLAPDTYDEDLGYESANATIQELINVSANLDHVFKYTKQNNPEFGWIYMGFEEGLFRSYPWSMFKTEYDPRTRLWYDLTTEEKAEGYKITVPYKDANGLGLMITVAKEVFLNDEKIGTIAIDLTISQIQDTILDINFLTSGYAFLIDSSGLAIAHKDLDLDDLEGDETLSTNIQEFEPLTISAYNELLSEESGFLTYNTTSDNTTPMYLAFSKIQNTDYIVASVVPQEEAIESVSVLANEISTATSRITVQIIVIIIIAGLISIGVGTIIAGQITKPVGFLTNAIQKLTKQDSLQSIMNSEEDIEIDEKLESQTDEIGDLTRAFKGMLNSIRNDQENR